MNRRSFIGGMAAGWAAVQSQQVEAEDRMPSKQPNVLFLMTDQQRFDTIAALGNSEIYTPNMDRLVRRGLAFTNAYSSCPVCVPARYNIRTGCESHTTGVYQNGPPALVADQPRDMEERCGPYLAHRMRELGYRTFGIGKFHTIPWNEDIGYDVHLRSEELYGTPEQRQGDAYARWVAEEHPEYDWVESLMGERTEMYNIPQMSPTPLDVAVEGWAAARAVEQIGAQSDKPYFGFVSFIGPHPPLAPPLPFNRLYDPDGMPDPVRGAREIDLMDEHLNWMNYAVWSEDVSDSHVRMAKARYYGEITYIDYCIGKILDAVEAREDADNTVICFFSDHGEHLGDHHSWQKESYFEQSAHIPFLVSWPAVLPQDERRAELVKLTDLFGIATHAAGAPEPREGVDVLAMVQGKAEPRRYVHGFYGTPGTRAFKTMVRDDAWKYIYMANGGSEQLFNLKEDPHELRQRIDDAPEVAERLRSEAIGALQRPNINRALEAGKLRAFPYQARELVRIYQFDHSRGVRGFPEHPADVLKDFDESRFTSR